MIDIVESKHVVNVLYTKPVGKRSPLDRKNIVESLVEKENLVEVLLQIIEKIRNHGLTSMPYFHITTSTSIEGFKEPIRKHTNVFKFLPCDSANNFVREAASLNAFESHPDWLLKNIVMMLQHGAYHSMRKNHPGEHEKNQNPGSPVLILIDGASGTERPHTDFAQHYLISNQEGKQMKILTRCDIPATLIHVFGTGSVKLKNILCKQKNIIALKEFLHNLSESLN